MSSKIKRVVFTTLVLVVILIISLMGFVGCTGEPGKSAYEIWLEQGNTGTEQDYLNSLIPEITIGDNGNWFINRI